MLNCTYFLLQQKVTSQCLMHFCMIKACNVKWLGLRGNDLQLIPEQSMVPLKQRDLQIATSLMSSEFLQVNYPPPQNFVPFHQSHVRSSRFILSTRKFFIQCKTRSVLIANRCFGMAGELQRRTSSNGSAWSESRNRGSVLPRIWLFR